MILKLFSTIPIRTLGCYVVWVLVGVGCCSDTRNISVFWPGVTRIGTKATPEFPHELLTVLSRFRNGVPLDANLANNIAREIDSLEGLKGFKMAEARSVSDYAALVRGEGFVDGKLEEVVVLMRTDTVVEGICYYVITDY